MRHKDSLSEVMTGTPNSSQTRSRPIEHKSQLVELLSAGCKPKEAWRIGTEHEKFCFHLDGHAPLSYPEKGGIRDVLHGLQRFGWQPVLEGENVIALKQDGASVSLEPGGQLELSGGLLETIHQTCDEVHTHLAQVKSIGDVLKIGFLGLGFHPFLRREDVPIMPKARYNIMRSYMPKKGTLGLDMMLRTCTVQTNLDFSSEADMVKKFRVALALQPVATALFANSPFTEGKPNGFKSYRSHIWTDTDPDRTGMLPFVFEDGFGFERYVDYVLDVPMYFVYRDGYIDASGQSFHDFLDGRLAAYSGQKPTLGDFEDHMTTIFPEVRLKTFLEMRGADGGPWSRLCALPAFWAGLLYDQSALDAAWDLCRDWTVEEMQKLRMSVPKLALDAPWRGGTLNDLARQVLKIADHGLKARARLNSSGDTEQGFLATLFESVETGKTPADELLEAYHGRWQGNVSKVFDEYSY